MVSLTSVSDLDPDWIRIRNPDPDPGRQKMTNKIEKSQKNFMFGSAGCSLLRAEGFSWSVDVLLWRPRDM
jgi:hypothetical protein